MDSPLNLNLLIPFKDNKGRQQSLLFKDTAQYKNQIEVRMDEIKDVLAGVLGGQAAVSIVARSDGNSKRYFWRYKSSKQDRGFHRIFSDTMKLFLSSLSNPQQLAVLEIEDEIIRINGNLKLIKGVLDSINQSNKELDELMRLNLNKLTD